MIRGPEPSVAGRGCPWNTHLSCHLPPFPSHSPRTKDGEGRETLPSLLLGSTVPVPPGPRLWVRICHIIKPDMKPVSLLLNSIQQCASRLLCNLILYIHSFSLAGNRRSPGVPSWALLYNPLWCHVEQLVHNWWTTEKTQATEPGPGKWQQIGNHDFSFKNPCYLPNNKEAHYLG